MPSHRARLRSLSTSAAVGALTIAGLVVATAPAAQAVSAPGSLQADVRNSSTVALSWNAVGSARNYEIQVDNNSGFGSPEYKTYTYNTRAVPTTQLTPGLNYWRVRALTGSDTSSWAHGSFTMDQVATPIPLSPAEGATLVQPQDPPLLEWTSSQGATSYKVEVDGDADLIGAKTYTTKSTSLVVPDPLTSGDWFWRVTAIKGAGLTSLPSDVASFNISPLDLPQITYPSNDVNDSIEDVALDWTPVPGAASYDVQVALDSDFNNIALTATKVRSTRYSPVVTLNSDQFWWRVRAVDLAGQSTPWTTSLYGFKRQWPEKPAAVYPLGDPGSPTALTTAKPFYQWTAVPHATLYELYTASDQFFSVNVDRCRVVGTTYAPRSPNDCAFHTSGVTYWEVRPIDAPYQPSPGLPGNFSTTQAFTWTDPGISGVFDPNTTVTGLKIAVDGTGITDGAKGCTDTLCTGVPSTPVVSWDPVPGATSYQVYFAQDENFTTTELPHVPVTSNTMLALEWDSTTDDVSTLPESQAGSAYYWYVRPCGPSGCGASPVSQNPPLPGAKSFRKASPAITGLTSSDPSGSEITFDWQDYYTTNQATTWNGNVANQSAKTYKIQVATDTSFSNLVDTRTVDQTTYTAFDKLYPEGTYFWRVQAMDAENNGLTWSPVETFTKSSPAVQLSSPVSQAHVPGTTPFRWAAQPFAAAYTVEAYKNHDTTFSVANRVFTATVKTTAYTPPSPIPASSDYYVWRVRRIDSSTNPGPWSDPGSFYSTGSAPSLITPAAKARVASKRGYFEWTEVPGATSYTINFGGKLTSSVKTLATAYTPTSALATGSYTWSVNALDSAGHVLASSVTRSFTVDATAPTVTSVTPSTLKPSSTLKVYFSEKVRGVSATTVRLYRATSSGKVKITCTVKLDSTGKVATVDPSGSLKAGTYSLVFTTSKITDLAGNTLVPITVTRKL